jgi:hypothetical protein
MLRIREILVAGTTAAVFFFLSVACAYTSTVPTLVYNFTYSTNQNVTARDSSTSIEGVATDALAGGTNGISHYNGSLTDKGTMTVQMIGKQQDGGLIVTISENGQQTRRAPAATCVVYGNTRVICDPNKTVYSEEYTLLRFLGLNFVDPNNIDAKRHWQINQDSPNLNITADYVIGPTTTSDVQVSETRKIRQSGGGSLTTDIQTKIDYDMSRTLPTTVDEYVTQRHDNGVAGTSTTIYQTTLQLVSDSTAKT